MTTATTILARAEGAGLLLRLGPDGEVEMQGPAPPDGLVADLRHHWADVRHLLRLRQSLGIVQPPGWLESTARAIRDAMASGARQQADPDGWYFVTAPNGQQIAVAPDTLMQIVRAGLLRPPPPQQDAPAEAAEAVEPEGAGA